MELGTTMQRTIGNLVLNFSQRMKESKETEQKSLVCLTTTQLFGDVQFNILQPLKSFIKNCNKRKMPLLKAGYKII